MITKSHIVAAILMALPGLAQAVELALPVGAVLSGEKQDGMTSQRLPIGPYQLGEIPAIWAEGARKLEAWHTTGSNLSSLQVIAPLRDQLEDQGFQVLYECRDIECGGFDFRFAQEVLPEPDMHINLGDYRFLSAQRMTDDLPEYIALLVSRNRARGFVHITTIGAQQPAELVPALSATKNDATELLGIEADLDLGSVLERDGVAVLEDLDFGVGSSSLAPGEFSSLAALADYLIANPTMTVSLVGHTDAVGSMAANFALSKARASSVRDRLINLFGVAAAQVDSQGVGYLAPLASNLSEDGRSLNRRVEVVLTATN